MPKKTARLCCQVNPVDDCFICGKVICTFHAASSMDNWTCKSSKCIAAFERHQLQIQIDLKRKHEQDREFRMKALGAKPTPDTSSNGYRLLKRIESSSPHKKSKRH